MCLNLLCPRFALLSVEHIRIKAFFTSNTDCPPVCRPWRVDPCIMAELPAMCYISAVFVCLTRVVLKSTARGTAWYELAELTVDVVTLAAGLAATRLLHRKAFVLLVSSHKSLSWRWQQGMWLDMKLQTHEDNSANSANLFFIYTSSINKCFVEACWWRMYTFSIDKIEDLYKVHDIFLIQIA